LRLASAKQFNPEKNKEINFAKEEEIRKFVKMIAPSLLKQPANIPNFSLAKKKKA
jgi:hypothetical protein